MTRRGFLRLAGATAALMLLAACRGAAASEAPGAEKVAPLAGSATMPPVVVPQAAPAAASPQAAPTAAPVVARAEPKGKFVQGWNTTIAPAWLDPQENPPQVTPYSFQYALHDAMVRHMPGK